MTKQILSRNLGFVNWYNKRKRSTIVEFNFTFIFLCTSFLPSFILNFPNLLTTVFDSSNLSPLTPLNYTYFMWVSLVYALAVGFTYLIELGESERPDNITFSLFSIIMFLLIMVLFLLGFCLFTTVLT